MGDRASNHEGVACADGVGSPINRLLHIQRAELRSESSRRRRPRLALLRLRLRPYPPRAA